MKLTLSSCKQSYRLTIFNQPIVLLKKRSLNLHRKLVWTLLKFFCCHFSFKLSQLLSNEVCSHWAVSIKMKRPFVVITAHKNDLCFFLVDHSPILKCLISFDIFWSFFKRASFCLFSSFLLKKHSFHIFVQFQTSDQTLFNFLILREI